MNDEPRWGLHANSVIVVIVVTGWMWHSVVGVGPPCSPPPPKFNIWNVLPKFLFAQDTGISSENGLEQECFGLGKLRFQAVEYLWLHMKISLQCKVTHNVHVRAPMCDSQEEAHSGIFHLAFEHIHGD